MPTLPAPAVAFHVAPTGDDAADGSEGKPFRTLEKARDAVRAFRQSHGGTLPKGGVKITIGGGSYPVEHSLMLTAEDSGTVEAPVVYEAKSGETPIFRGGLRITAWKPISDAGVRDKLDPSVRDRVLEADLKALGVTDWGDATATAPPAGAVRERRTADARPLAERRLCQDGRHPGQGDFQGLEHDRGLQRWQVPVRGGPSERLAR